MGLFDIFEDAAEFLVEDVPNFIAEDIPDKIMSTVENFGNFLFGG